MALWPAGSKLSAGKIESISAMTPLSDATASTVADQQWGTEYAAFDSPGVECVVEALLIGRMLGRGSAGTTADTLTVWLQISVDAGATWNSGTQYALNDCPVAGATFRSQLVVAHRYQAVPAGQIRVRGMWTPKYSGQRLSTGLILANLTGA